MTVIIALIIAFAIPVMFLFFVRGLDIYRTGTTGNFYLSAAWGIVAYLLAAQINPAMSTFGLLDYDNVIRFSAPITEEILKGLILLYIVRRADFTYFVDGAIYGFAAGIGFAVIENFEYVLGNPDAALINAIGRVLSTNLIHATGSGIIGIAIGKARFDKATQRAISLATGLGMAMALHIGFNNLVTRVSSGLLLVYAIAAGFTGAGYIIYNIKLGLKEEKEWIAETLGEADRVTAQEAAAVQKLDKMQELTRPIVEKFGQEKASIVEEFLTMQAKLGILRKTRDKLQDEKMRQAVDKQMDALREKMDFLRKSVGSYCMLYLRGTFLEESSPLWGRLETIIQERTQSGAKREGPSLWSNLDGRISRPAGTSDSTNNL